VAVLASGILVLATPRLATGLGLNDQILFYAGLVVPALVGPWAGRLSTRFEVVLRFLFAASVFGLSGLLWAIGWHDLSSTGFLLYPFIAMEAGTLFVSSRIARHVRVSAEAHGP